MIKEESLNFKELEHVLIEKVEQLFRDMLYRSQLISAPPAPATYGRKTFAAGNRLLPQTAA